MVCLPSFGISVLVPGLQLQRGMQGVSPSLGIPLSSSGWFWEVLVVEWAGQREAHSAVNCAGCVSAVAPRSEVFGTLCVAFEGQQDADLSPECALWLVEGPVPREPRVCLVLRACGYKGP